MHIIYKTLRWSTSDIVVMAAMIAITALVDAVNIVSITAMVNIGDIEAIVYNIDYIESMSSTW